MKKKFYITTAIDYTNDVIHIGHAYQKILADCLARYHRLIGDETYFLTGTDEHGQKVQKAASEKGIDPQTFVDGIAEKDKKEWESLHISFDRFIRTTDEDHKQTAQEFYKKVEENGDIYKGTYKGYYCEGCETYVDEAKSAHDVCPFHPNKKLEFVSEESYFFKLSNYEQFLLDHIKSHPEFIQPESKRNEIVSFIKQGLKDFSVTRKNVSWGIPVPDKSELTIYVWFDALVNYFTYGKQKNIWPATVHVLGKDNQRFHAVYWPAMLKSAGYELPETILVHDFISLEGRKISKSLGNVILPSDLVKQFDADAVRYYFLRYGPLTNDIDISLDKIKTIYNADLANGLGNLVARVAKLAEKAKINLPHQSSLIKILCSAQNDDFHKFLKEYRINEAVEFIWKKISGLDKKINEKKPWELKEDQLREVLMPIAESIVEIAVLLQPFLPDTAEKIQKQFTGEIKSEKPLFPRI
jgi:methionyl-tRNA synthetase